MEQHPSFQKETLSDSTNIREQIDAYLVHWKWFVLSTILSLVIGRYYYKSQTPLYEVSATILIKDDKKGELSELSAFEDLGLLKKSSNIDNEIEILKSRSLMMRVVRDLNLNISYFVQEKHFGILNSTSWFLSVTWPCASISGTPRLTRRSPPW